MRRKVHGVLRCFIPVTRDSTMMMPNEAFDTLLDNYYEDGLKLNPVSATYAGDNRYNDQCQS